MPGSLELINIYSKYLLYLFQVMLVEHRTGVAEVTGSNRVEALIFFRLLASNCLNWKIYCNDHSSLSSTTAVQYEFHIYFTLLYQPIHVLKSPLLTSVLLPQQYWNLSCTLKSTYCGRPPPPRTCVLQRVRRSQYA